MFSELSWIDTQYHSMVQLLTHLVHINSGSENLQGLERMLNALKSSFSSLGGEMREIELPPRQIIDSHGNLTTFPHGKMLHLIKRPEATRRILLGGHMDTVYSETHPFQKAESIDDKTMRGPGTADMKGGLVIMLTALQALEKHPQAKNIGWEVFINPDEEIGSDGSETFIAECAKRNHVGLLFEPSFADGAVVSSRKGSLNMTVISRGKSAHAGRDFEKGNNAITKLADFAIKAEQLSHREKGISVNIGSFNGGGPVNIVPDLAMCRLNARAVNEEDFVELQKRLCQLIETQPAHGASLSFNLDTTRGPKPFDKKCERLFEQINRCAQEEGYTLKHRPSGGVCDGNLLSAEGLPVIDTLGAIGGDIHTTNEYILLPSLTQRARLVALFMIKLATGELQ